LDVSLQVLPDHTCDVRPLHEKSEWVLEELLSYLSPLTSLISSPRLTECAEVEAEATSPRTLVEEAEGIVAPLVVSPLREIEGVLESWGAASDGA